MSINYDQRFAKLRDRRQGLSTRKTDGILEAMAKVGAERKAEKFEKLAQPRAVSLAWGMMQPVDAEYTRVTVEQGNRVQNQLASGLAAAGIRHSFEYQGSVPLDVHVHGNSDIDLLVLRDEFVTTAPGVTEAFPHSYSPYYGPPPIDSLKTLREECKSILTRSYPSAVVDSKGGKSINVSEGSLRRVVDVVPAHWHDTYTWKTLNDQAHREVYVYDNNRNVRISNAPFMHIKLVMEKCLNTGGSCRKVIRLLKHLKYDADIELSSFDIAAVGWNFPDDFLNVPVLADILLVDRARQYLEFLVGNPTYRDGLKVPDGSRAIFNEPKKALELVKLLDEVTLLRDAIYEEVEPASNFNRRSVQDVLANRLVYAP